MVKPTFKDNDWLLMNPTPNATLQAPHDLWRRGVSNQLLSPNIPIGLLFIYSRISQMAPDHNSSWLTESRETFHPGTNEATGDKGLEGLPAHVTAVKDGLLDFYGFLGLEAIMLVLGGDNSHEDDLIPLSAYKTDGLKTSQRAWEREFLENAQALAEGAHRLEGTFAEDGEWRSLFRSAVASRMEGIHYSSAGNEVWDNDLDPSRSSSSSPKPDLYFGFPVHNTEGNKRVGFRNDPSFRNFHIQTISQLAMKGLRSVPVSSSLNDIAGMKRESLELQPQLLCFPWCIFQLKGFEETASIKENDSSVLETFREASIAASDALCLLENLARFADVKKDSQHIPPVITITCVGPNTTVGIAFTEIIDDQYRDHHILSIWNGCISKIWDAIQFCRIMENLFVWSQHILRPKVSQYIDQWRLRYCPEVPNTHVQLEKDVETAELVHRIQDRLSSLNISRNANLPDLIQQAVIFQEVMKSSLPKAESAPREGPKENAQLKVKSSTNVPMSPGVEPSAVIASDIGVDEGSKEDGEFRKEEEEKEEGRTDQGMKDEDDKGQSIHGQKQTWDDEWEDEKENNDLGDKNAKYSSVILQDEQTLRPTTHEKNILTPTDSVVGCATCATGGLTATTNNQAASTKTLPDSEQLPKHASLTFKVDGKPGKGPSFYCPYKFKTSDFEFKEATSLSHQFAFPIREGQFLASKDIYGERIQMAFQKLPTHTRLNQIRATEQERDTPTFFGDLTAERTIHSGKTAPCSTTDIRKFSFRSYSRLALAYS